MAQFFQLHPEQPQPRLIRHAVEIIREGGLIAFPTDSAYALGGHTGDAKLLERIRRIRGVDERHHFTLMCRDLSEIAIYARVDNAQYRLLKSATPGSYTFLLEGTKELAATRPAPQAQDDRLAGARPSAGARPARGIWASRCCRRR